jgi:pseudouridine-5'-phosphate glycosidase
VRDAGGLISFAPEVEEALRRDLPVVALETTLIAHGFPPGEGAEVGRESERRVRAAGAVPATIGIIDGRIRVGLDESELERFSAAGAGARKLGPRDLAACIAQGALGATTVGGTLAVMRAAGIRFMGTGGLGGVHRGFPFPPDVSADLAELARTEALVVSAGIKSLLDVEATAEALETLGVPVLGFRTDELPLFYVARGGPAVSARVESAEEAARVAAAHWGLGRGGLTLARPPDASLSGDETEALIREALAAAERDGVRGQAVTPFLLAFLHERSGGATMEVNRGLAAANAGLAGAVAAACAAL